MSLSHLPIHTHNLKNRSFFRIFQVRNSMLSHDLYLKFLLYNSGSDRSNQDTLFQTKKLVFKDLICCYKALNSIFYILPKFIK
jgi:hypothetical protein